jgi:hypothetical protein
LKLFNTTLTGLPYSIFKKVGFVYNISIDIDSNNKKFSTIPNPNTAIYPNQPDTVLLTNLNIFYSSLTCDCDIGWVEFWQRKKRQYFCSAHNWNNNEILKSEMVQNDECDNPYHDDDLRSARCSNKNGEPLLEILKSELECGWNSSSRNEVNIPFLVAFAVCFMAFML